jgi:uncharacterized protein YjbI with pentapeptide repeats
MTERDESAVFADTLLKRLSVEIPGLSLSSAQILLTVALRPGLGLSELSAASGVEFGQGSRPILDLSQFPLDDGQHCGLVELRPHGDKSSDTKAVHLNQHGRIKLDAILASLDDVWVSRAGEEPSETILVPIYHRYHHGLIFTATVACEASASVGRKRELALRWAEAKGLDLNDAAFGRVLIAGLTLRGRKVRAIDLRESVLDDADFSKSELSQADFSAGDLRGATFTDAKMSCVSFRGCNLEAADLSRTDMRMASLGEANLRQARLTGADLTDADMSRTTLRGAHLDGAILTKARLPGADLASVSLVGADLSHTDLRGANLLYVNLGRANLRGANLHRAKIREYDMVPYRDDVWRMLDLAPTFIPALGQALIDGQIQGAVDDRPGGTGAALYDALTRAGARDLPCDPDAPAERWFAMILPGDLPGETRIDGSGQPLDHAIPNAEAMDYAHRHRLANGGTVSEITLRWIAQYCQARGLAIPERAVIKPPDSIGLGCHSIKTG